MKRAAELAPLSREHHEALVLARRACGGADPAGVRERVLRQWTRQIEPHFDTEERVLLPALLAAGADDPAAVAWRQHDRLRSLVERLHAADLAALPEWGEAMREHVRFEERELFPLAERLLELGTLGHGLARLLQGTSP